MPVASPSSSIFDTLAGFVLDLRIETVPEPVLRRVDHVLMDLVASTWSALDGSGAQALWRYARTMNPQPQATLWGSAHKVAVAEAATVNGALGYEAEYDDGNTLGGHWGSASIPAILALAQHQGAPASEVALAIVAAYEVGNRVSRALSQGLLERGIHFPGTMGAVAAIAGAGRLRGLDRTALAGALGHAALLPVAPYWPGHAGVDGKNLYSGWPNHCGIHFTALAQAGYLGAADLLEGRDGLAQVLGWTGTAAQLQHAVCDGLGERWAIAQTYFKAFPCCRWLHAPVQGVLELMAQHALEPLDIRELRVRGPAFLAMYASGEPCSRPTQAKYSLSHCVAAAALHGELGQAQFSPAALTDRALAELAARMEFSVDATLQSQFPQRFSTIVEILTRDGRTLRAQTVPPWGPDAPPELDDLADKFMPIMRDACGEAIANDWLAWFRRGLLADPQMQAFFDLLQRATVR